MSQRSYVKVAEDPRSDWDSCEVDAVDSDAVERVRGELVGPARVKRTTDIFAALSDPTRFAILHALSFEELCVCDVASVVGMSQSAVSHQLRMLRNLDLVAFRKDGKRAVYRLADDHVRVLISQGLEHADEER